MQMQIGMIGFGNMAGAIAGGILKGKQVSPEQVGVFDIQAAALERAKAMRFTPFSTPEALVKQAKYIFLCVKPQNFSELLPALTSSVHTENVFLTIAAGVPISTVTQTLGKVPVLRAMPNTPMLLGCGAVALTKNALVSPEDFSFIRSIFEQVGSVYELPENKFNEVINVNGSTPAYIYLLTKIIVDFAEKSGIPASVALPMFCDTLMGSAKMLTESGKTPQELIDMVSSKGGTTVAALEAFSKTGFQESLEAGMQACVDRAYALNP